MDTKDTKKGAARDFDLTLPLVRNTKDIGLLAILLMRRLEALRREEGSNPPARPMLSGDFYPIDEEGEPDGTQ